MTRLGGGKGRGETGKTSSRVVWRVTTGRTGTGSGVATRLGEGRGERGNWEDVEQGGVEGDDDGELEQGAAWSAD